MRIKASYETESFINKNGYYAIKQESCCARCGDDQPVVVQLTPDQMRLIIEDMKEALENAEEWFEETETGV